MSIKKYVLSLVCIMGFFSATLTADSYKKEISIDQYIKELNTTLSLSSDQNRSIRKILEDSKAKLKAQDTSEKERKPEQWVAVKQETDQKILTVLNASQKEKYKAFKAAKKEKRQAQIQAAMQSKLTKELSLSKDQQTQLKEILANTHQEMDDILPKDGKWDKETKEKVREIKNKQNEDIKAILTEEQKEKFQELKQHKEHRMKKAHAKS